MNIVTDDVELETSLDSLPESEGEENLVEPEPVTPPYVDPLTARTGTRILGARGGRDSVRLLICTRSASLLEEGSLLHRRLLELGNLFAEIHVIVFTYGRGEKPMTVRLSDTVWAYTTASSSWWKCCFDAYHIAKEQLTFAGGFRADIIISEDPFEAGLAGYFIARKFERPFQIHLFEDIYDQGFKKREPENPYRLFIARYLFSRTPHVRVQSESVRLSLLQMYPELSERTETLPFYYDLVAWRDAMPQFDLKERYTQFKFIILHVSSMGLRSHTDVVIEGVTPLLRMYPTIGLVIVGNGPLRSTIEKQVSLLGVAGRIVFEPAQSDVISHMKSSHVLVHLSEDSEDDVVLLEAASVRLPIIGLASGLAGSLFVNGESALLCERPDAHSVGQYLRTFLNDNSSRLQLGALAQEAVFERVEQDYVAYLEAYRSSIERCI